MSPARRPPSTRDRVRLLVVDPDHEPVERQFAQLPEVLRPGDVVVLNDAATLPASLRTKIAGEPVELRLLPHDGGDGAQWRAVVLGSGDWSQDTNQRGIAPALACGHALTMGDLHATVMSTEAGGRLVSLRFRERGEAFWSSLYRAGRPVQYSHQSSALPLEAFQTIYATRPWASEMPSAGRALTWNVLGRLRASGVRVCGLTHAAGLSALGDPTLDRMLPLPEAYDLPAKTVELVHAAKAAGHRVIAIGTTVVRALEGSHRTHGRLVPGRGRTDLVLGEGSELHVVDGIVTGMHEPTESHYRLLGAFAPKDTLERAWRLARDHGFRSHEFGDLELIMRRRIEDLAA